MKSEHLVLAMELGLSAQNVNVEIRKFKDHEFAAPRSDWDAAFRNWLRRAAEHASTQPAASSRDGTVIVKHPVFRPEPRIPASQKPNSQELSEMLSKVGRVAT